MLLPLKAKALAYKATADQPYIGSIILQCGAHRPV
jgi:hypothetical protein